MFLQAAIAVLAACAVAEGSILSLAGADMFKQTATSVGVGSAAWMALLWGARRIHSARQINVPLPWREGAPGVGGGWDSLPRNVAKTIMTVMLIAVVPWQASIVAGCLVWQFALHFGGFGGGRPGGVPTDTPATLGFVRRFWEIVYKGCDAIAPYILNDVRNAPLLVPIFGLSVYTPLLFYSFAKMHLAGDGTISIPMAYLYRVLQMGPYFKFFANAAVMIHKEGHANKHPKGLFKGPLAPVLNHVCEWWLAFFYGHTPENYRVGHVEVHHAEGNNHYDATSTLYLDRSKSSSFVRYLGDFAEFWMGFAVVEYFAQRIALKKSRDVARDTRNYNFQMMGICGFYAAFAAVCISIDVKFAIVYFMIPHLEIINYLAAINYTWHTFVDPEDIDNEYIKSITIIEGHYPLFGEDFHVEHHLRPGLHWSKSPDAYEKHAEDYTKNRATVFRDTQEFELFFLILLGEHDELAKRFVDLKGDFPTHEDKVKELRRRMSAVPRP